MAVDTPATIAVIGAGPIGLEAALYARFLGYDVRIYERDAVARSLRQGEGACAARLAGQHFAAGHCRALRTTCPVAAGRA